jgi:uncharacterized repeat protein (TIGR01451 family)
VTPKNLGEALCLALIAPALAFAGFVPNDPLGVLREQAKLAGVGDPVGDRNEFFGSAVAADGDTVVVGAPGVDFFDTGAVYVFVRSAGAWTLEARLSPPGARRLGNAVAVFGDTVVAGSAEDSLVYVFVRTAGTWSLQAQLAGSDTTAGDGFGATVSVSGDTIVVGAPDHHTGFGIQSGAAYVFVGSGGTWTEQQRVVSDLLAAQDYFGTSVSVSGDSLAVGAPGDDTGVGLEAGSAHVFTRSGTVWSQEARLFLPDGSFGDAFGTSVSLDGATLFVGTPGESEAGLPSTGAAYVYVRSGGSWSLEQRLVTATPTATFSFGTAVALQADTAIVGSPRDSAGLFEAGAAHVFVRAGGVWSEQQKLIASVPEVQAGLGRAVAVSGDVVVAGAPLRDVNSGSVFVFRDTGPTWDEEARLDPPGTARSDAFGSAVALEEDVLLVGAPRDDIPGGRGAGSAYVFVRTGSSWGLPQKIVAGDPSEDARFGATVAISGDTLVVGAPEAGDGESGAVYVFVLVGSLWELQQKIEHPGGSTVSRFGHAVALDGDSLLVGAPDDEEAGLSDAGAAHVFVRSGASWSLQQTLVETVPVPFARAGFAVALEGNRALLGTSGDSVAGRVTVFERAAGLWTEMASLSAADGTQGDNFGAAVALAGDTAIVGAPDAEGPSGFINGAGYVFVRDRTGSWSQQQKLTDSSPENPFDLGATVAISGDTALVGPAGNFTSAVLLFARQGGVWTLRQRIVSSEGGHDEGFGFAVALSGQTAAVGARAADTPAGLDSGAVYVLVPAMTDLAVTIDGTPASVVQGDLVTYTIVVSNNGPDVAPAVGLVDSLDPGLVVSSASASQGTCTLLGSGAACDLGAVSAGSSATVTVVAAGALVGPQSSHASISWDGSDPVPGNDASSTSTIVTSGAPADVSVTKTSITPVAQVGANVVYQVRVENLGPGNAAGIVVSDPTPPGLVPTLVSGSGCSSLPCVFPRMLAGEQQDLAIIFDIPASYPGPDPIVNTATVTSLTDDPVALNNSSTVETPFFLPAGNLDFHTLTPCRLFDTRNPASGGPFPLEAGSIRALAPYLSDCGVPATAQAVAVNVTVTEPTATGNLRLYPAGLPVPSVSTLNYWAGQTRGNNAVVSLNHNHAFAVRVGQPSGTVHVIIDVFGYFE